MTEPLIHDPGNEKIASELAATTGKSVGLFKFRRLAQVWQSDT